MTLNIKKMIASDWDAVKEIYLEGIATGAATFEVEAPAWDAWDQSHLPFARLVARNDSAIFGWAALSPVSLRRAYAGVAEVSIYVAASNRRQGIGRCLLEALIHESEAHGIWTLQASVFPENIGTVTLHQRCGFREVGRRERISKLNGVWRDTVMMERRSIAVGVD